jgi:hypothetical protein
VHGRELVKELGLNELQAGLKEFCANTKRKDATNHKHGEAEPQVQGPDIFVIRRIDPPTPAMWMIVIVAVIVAG